MLNKEMEKPTLSIILITYNSAAYVRETLESIRAQQDEAVELIITDDCSTDNTVAVIREWLNDAANSLKFSRVELLANPVNQGVAGNCNAGLKASEGEWIKLIAGDDLLLPSCISTFIKAVSAHPSAKLFVCKMQVFQDELKNPVYVWPIVPIAESLPTQFRYQLRGSYIKAPAVLMNARVLKGFGGFDLNIPFLEDDPLWVKFLQHDYPFVFIPEVLVAYRIHAASISNGKGAKYMSVLFFNSLKKYKEEIALPLLKEKGMWIWHFLVSLEFNAMKEIMDQGNHGQLKFKHRLIFKLVSVFRERAKQFNL